MATEIDIPESVLLKEVKTEENAFSSESLEEKVKLVDNKVKHLETSNLVAEPVNTKLETGIMTNESETFFQAPSVPMVTADELSKTPEANKDTPKQEHQEEIKVTKIEALTDQKPVDDVVEAVSTQTEREVETIGNEDKNDGKAIQIEEETQEKEQALNTLEKDQVADSKEQDLNEMSREFVKEDTSNDAQEASEQCENGANEEREQKPEESVQNIVLTTAEIKQEEKAEEFPGVEIVEEVKQNRLLHEEKGEEATQSDDGQKEKSENPLIAEVREENSSEKIDYKASTPIATVNKDEAKEKEQDVNVLEKDQGKDGVTSIQDMMPEGGLEETKHQGDCNEAEVKAKESMEKETEEIIYSVGTPENIEPKFLNNVIPTDVSITAHTKPEETMQNEEQNDVEAIDIEDGETKDSGSSMVKEICEEPVSDKANTEEGLRPSESSTKESIENDVVSKDEGQEKNDVECSQDEPSTGDLEAKTNETITNDEKATEKEASDETGPENTEPEAGLKVSGSMEPTKVEVLSTIEKNQGDTDGVISSQHATCEDIKETESGENESTVADTEELNETPREFKEEAEGKSIDSKASYHSENKAEEKLVERPDESLNESEQKEEIEDIRPSAVLEEKMVHVETWEHEEKVEAEATHSDDGQTEKLDNPAVTKVCEENSSEKVESECSSMMLNEQVTSILTKDEDEEKEQEVTVIVKDQGEDSVTSGQDVPFEGCLEETNHDSEGIEPEVVNAKGSVEEDIGEIKSSAETLDKKVQTVNPTDISITTQTKQEEETIGNEEKNDEKAMKSDYGETKESGSPIVSEICEETVSHNAESVEGLEISDTSSTATNEHEIASKNETRAQVQNREEDDVTFSQAATSIEDLHVENKENIIDEGKNVEDAIEKEPCEDMGPKNVDSEAGLKVSDTMQPSVKEAFSTEEKEDQGDIDGVPRSQDATCVDVKETTQTIVGDFKELSETPREFIKEETEDKTIDVQETNDDCENKAENKLLERSDESVKEIEKEEEIEEIRPSVEIEEQREKNELLQGVTTDASISKQTELQDEITEPGNKGEAEASQSDDGQKEKYENSSINQVCEEISSEKVESESSKLNEIETSIVNKDENEEKEQEVIVLEKDQGEDGVTGAQNVPSEGCLKEANHDSEFIEPEVVDAKGSIEDATEEIRSSVKTPEYGTPETEVKNDGEAIKSDDGQVGIIVNEICEETVLHNTESEEGPTVFETSSKETNEHKLASKDETEEKNQDQEGDDVTVSQSAASLEDLKVENNDTTIKEEAIEKEVCEDMGTANVESGGSLKTYDNIEPSVKEALSTVDKEQCDTDGFPSSQDATCEDTETTSTIVSDSKELNETTREFIKEETEDRSVIQEVIFQAMSFFTSAKDVPSEACLKETSLDNESIESEAKNTQESVEGDTKKIRSSVETLEEGATENKEKDDEEAINSEASRTEESGIPIVEEICEETVSHNTESEEGLKVSDISSKEINEHELASKDEAEEKEQDQEEDDVTCSHDATSIEDFQENKNESTTKEDKNDEVTIEKEATEEIHAENTESEVGLKHSDDMEPSKKVALDTIEKDQGNLDGVTSSQDATIVDEFKELKEEERPSEFFKEETEDNLTEAQEATEKCENRAQDNIEQRPEESVKKIELEEAKTKAIDPLVEIEEQNELLCDVTSDDSSISTQTKPQAETLEHEEKNEVVTQSDDSQNKTSDKPSIKEVCEDEKQETVEYETSTPITVINKDEDQEHDQAVNVLEKDEGEDDVTSSQKATPTDVCISTQTILEKESTENEEKNAEEVVESDNSQTMKSGIPLDKEICEEIMSEKETKDDDQELDISEKSQSGGEDVKSSQIAANEHLKETTIAQYVATVAYPEEPPALSAIPKETLKEETEDKLIDVQKAREYEDREIPEKIDVCISTPTEAHEEATQIEEKDLHNTVPEEVIDLFNIQENEKELNISEKDQGKDEVTCSKDPAAVSEENLQGKYEDEDAEQKIGETREIPKEYNEVIQTSGETEEKMEQHIESKQEITKKEVCEETVKVVCEEATSEKVEPVEALELSDSSEIKINEKTITSSIDEGQEETTEIEEKNDDVIRSDDESKEELKESTGESATPVTYIEEGQDLSTLTKEILEEEAEDKSFDVQQASRDSENGGKDEREQQPEESVNKQVDSCSNVVEENIKEGESDLGKKEEVDIEKQNNEAGEADDVKECETIGGTQELSPENKDEATGDVSKSIEGVSQDVESLYDKAGSPLGDKTDDETLKKKEDQYTEAEKILSELENSKEESVEKIPACSTEIISEKKDDDEITEKTEDSSQDSIKGNECTTKEEQRVLDERTRESKISTLEHEPIEEKIGGVDEVSKDKSTDLKETAEVEPQEDITPSSCIETSTVDTSNSDKKKAENEDSPIEDVDSVSEVQTPEVVPESKDSKLKEECVNTTTFYVEEVKEIVSEGISSDEKTEQPVEIKKESVEEVCEENSTENTETEEGVEDDKSSVETKENTEQQGLLHVITTDVCSSAETKPNEDTVKNEEKNDEIGQPEVKNAEEILEKKEDDTTKENEDLFHDSTEDTVLDESTRDIEPQEDITPSSSSEILTTHTSNSEKVNSECENLPTEELKSVLEVQIAEVEPKTEESNLKEECLISATETHVDAEQVTVTKEISSDQILEPYGEKKLTHESTTDDHIEKTILQQEESDIASEKNQSVYEKGDLDEEATQANQLNSAEDCSERVKDVVLTKELSYSDPTPDGNHEVTKVIVDGQIGQNDIPAAKDISCKSTLEDDNVDKAPKEKQYPSIEGAATIETQVDSSNIESTACPSESEATPTQSLESVSAVIEGSEDSKVQENRIILATVEHTDHVTNVEEEEIISNCISSASDTKEDDNVKQAHFKSEEEKSSDLTTEEKSLTEEVDAESQTESGDIQAVEDLGSLSKASYTIEEGATEDTESTPNLDLEKEEKDNELISEVQSTPEALPKMGIKGEHPEAMDEKCETLRGGEISEKLLDAVKEIDTKEDIEVIAKAEEKEIEESKQDAVAEVMAHEHLQQTEEVVLEVDNSKESKIIEDNIDEEARCIQDSTKDTIEPKRTVVTPTEVCEFTSEAAEIVPESTEASPKILLVKHDSDIATNAEKIEDEIKEKDAVLQAPNLSSESGEGKQHSIGDMLNKAGDVVQPQEHISSTKSDVEIKEEVELTHDGSKQTSVEKKTEDSPVLLSEVKEQSEEAPHLNTEEATLPSVNHENQTEQKKEADKNIDAANYTEYVKNSDVELQSDMDVTVPNCTSTRKLEVRSADLELPSAMDAKDDKINLGSTCDKGKTTEEVSGIKQEPLELDAPVNTVATKDLDISHKGVTGDVTKEGGDVKSESAAPTKEEIADSGTKTDEENEEQEDNEDNENSGLCSETPVMVEASKDMEVKVHKKSHNILSGVGSKVKHSIAKVKKAITGGSWTLPSNTITNPKKDSKGITTRSGVAYQGPTNPTSSKVVKQGTEVTKDQVQTPSSQSTAPVQPLVVQPETQTPISHPVVAPVRVLMPNLKSSIPYPSRRDNERRRDQANEQIEKFYEIFKDVSFRISFTDALILMPKFSSTLKALIGNKEKLSEMAKTPMNEHCSAAILNKLPRKLGDPRKFLIHCEFPRMDECLALADLGASINLMPLSMWEGLSLPELTSTCMTLELADRSVSNPIDARVPLILRRCFLKTGRALIDVHKGELTLRIENKAIAYNLDQTVRYSANYY
nr:hypothetical protein [Tanacetum cinerariifolium]